MPTAVLVPIKETKNSTAFYHVFLLAVELVLVLTFLSLSVLIFFFCLEVILLLTYLLLYYWGSRLRKIRSSFYLLIFTILGSSLLLTGILFLLQIAGSTDLTLLDNFHFSIDQQKLLAFLFAAGSGIKLPAFPLAIWLPEAHTEASTPGSVVLAGISLKLGIYGLVRFTLTLFPIGIQWLSPLIFFISPFGCVTASVNCLRQYDLKKIIAYSSVGHMGFGIASLHTLNIWGLMGCIVTAAAHCLGSSALFLLAGFAYGRTHSRNLFSSQTLSNCYPAFSTFLFILILANLSFPGTLSFIGELLGIISLASVDFSISALFLLNILLTACYSLFLYERICFGKFMVRKTKLSKLLTKPFYLNSQMLVSNLRSRRKNRFVLYLLWKIISRNPINYRQLLNAYYEISFMLVNFKDLTRFDFWLSFIFVDLIILVGFKYI